MFSRVETCMSKVILMFYYKILNPFTPRYENTTTQPIEPKSIDNQRRCYDQHGEPTAWPDA